MPVASVDNSHFGGIIGEEKPLAVPVMLKIGMLHPADVIAGKIGKEDGIKDQPPRPSHP
jgi:hypothetical protein